jgi:methionyl-tRNA formyltransferase
MGTPEFSVPMLKAIHESKYELVGAVTAVDKPSGRGQKLSKSAVKEFAESKQIPLLQPKNMKSPEFLNQLKAFNPNLIVVVAFRMLPKQVWNFPEYGTFNLHASLLPQYRGAAPINWAIINGETKTGLTTFFLDEKIDTGEIIDQIELPIEKTDNLENVYNKILPKGVELVMTTIQTIEENETKTSKQTSEGVLKMAPKLTKENTKVILDKKGEEIYNLVRGLSPYPLAWTTLQHGNEEIQCKISKVFFHKSNHNKVNGEVKEENKSLFVAVDDGWLELLELKLSGKRLLKVKDLMNGFQLKTPSKMI